MKPRQIKKNSKSAMDLLIKVFGYEDDYFYYDESLNQWVVEYSVSEYDAVTALEEQYLWNTCDLVVEETHLRAVNNNNFSDIYLISYCRQLAKAGVKFR